MRKLLTVLVVLSAWTAAYPQARDRASPADVGASAKDGDADELRRLKAAVDAGSVDAIALVAALESAGSQTTPFLMTMLNKSAGPVRGAAAAALGRRKADEAKPALLALMKD